MGNFIDKSDLLIDWSKESKKKKKAYRDYHIDRIWFVVQIDPLTSIFSCLVRCFFNNCGMARMNQ